jgi:hypothetical protein
MLKLLTSAERDIISLPSDKLESYLRNDLFKCYFRGATDDNALQLLEQLIVKRTKI